VVVSSLELKPLRPEPEPVVMRGITLVPWHGTPVTVRAPSDRRLSALLLTLLNIDEQRCPDDFSGNAGEPDAFGERIHRKIPVGPQ
jgi:hypothetical protein